MLVQPESSSAVLAMMSSKSVSIYATVLMLQITGQQQKSPVFKGVPKFDALVYEGLLEPTESKITLLKPTFMIRLTLKILCAGPQVVLLYLQ